MVRTLLFYGIIWVQNPLRTIMSIELTLLAVNIVLMILSFYLDDSTGLFFMKFILVISAIKFSIGLFYFNYFFIVI